MPTFRIPAAQFRSLPAPVGKAKVGLCFAKAALLPADDLWEWREVNPREVNPRSAVYKAMSRTLVESPEQFHERNRGITIVADHFEYDEKRKEVTVQFGNNKLHGVVDGGHTLNAIRDAQNDPPEEWPAFVFIKLIMGVDEEQIAEIAGGLNTSQQVDLRSLENLKDHFASLRKVLKDQAYADKIAYKMNEDLPIDVREVLYYLAVFDATRYTETSHPVALFGRKEGIVRTFADQAAEKEDAGDSFKVLITKAPDILWLRDYIEKSLLALPSVGRYNSSKGQRVRSASNKKTPLYFLGEEVNGRIPLGWIMPMLASFRANVQWNKPKGTFSWKMPIQDLVDSCIERLFLVIKDVHEQENSRPEYVGRNSLAWRMTYSTVSQCILEWEISEMRSNKKR